MNKKIIALIVAVITVVMCFALVSCGDKQPAADSDMQYIKDKGTFIVGMTIYEPMNYEDENGELTGFDTELALLVGEELGLNVEFFEIADWDNKFIELETKNIDCVWNGMTITDDALNNSSVSIPYVKNAQVVVMAADKLEDYADAESMKDLKFVAEQGSAGYKEAVAAGFNCTEVKYQSDALLEVKSGAADACVIDITMANSMTGEGTSYADLGYKVELSTEEYGISFRQGSDLTEKVNEVLKALKEDGTLDELAKKYELTLAF